MNVYGGVLNVYRDDIDGDITVNVSGNTVTMAEGATVNGWTYGGYSNGTNFGTGDIIVNVSGNTVTLAKGAVSGSIYGGNGEGHSEGHGNLTITTSNNTVTMAEGAIVTGTIDGGRSKGFSDGDLTITANNNTVTLAEGAKVEGNAYGGNGTGSGSGDVAVNVTNNTVTLAESATVTGNVYGSYSYGYNSGNGDLSVTATSNTVTMAEGTTVNGDVYGGNGEGSGESESDLNVTANSNTVTLADGAKVKGNVYGGKSEGYGSGKDEAVFTLNANNNTVTLAEGATVNSNIYGGYGKGYGNGIFTVTASSNAVTMAEGTTVNGDVYGGNAEGYGNGKDEAVFTVTASSNAVKLAEGAKVEGSVYGGYAEGSGEDEGVFTLNANNNTVTLGSAVSVVSNIYGGYAEIGGDEVTDFNKVIAGNTLNVNGSGIKTGGFYNFENYNWMLPKTVANGDTIIEITGETAVDLTDTKHTVARENDGRRLNVGDQIILIDKASGEPDSVPTKVPDRIDQGHFITYDVDVKVDNEQLILRIAGIEDDGDGDGGHANPTSKSFLEGRAAALGFVSQGSDLIATAGIDNIRVMARSKDTEANRPPLIPFMIMQDASNRYKTGSHVDIDGFNMATGLATGFELEQGNKVTLGAFFEYGRGSYDSYNHFDGYGSVKGNGDIDYTGGGVFGRIDFAGTGLGWVSNLAPTKSDGLYLEASLRAGRISSTFDSDELIDPEGYRGRYDSKANYIGGHASAGYVFNFDEQQSLDVYGRYLWTRLGGDTVRVGIDTLKLDKSTSSRMQLGGRYSYSYSDQFKPYIGAAFEYEFKGDVGAEAYGLRLDEPSLKGSTGILNAGFTYMPNAKIPDLSLNINAQAFFGQRQGGAGQIKFKYQF